jgi:hypothetical protein
MKLVYTSNAVAAKAAAELTATGRRRHRGRCRRVAAVQSKAIVIGAAAAEAECKAIAAALKAEERRIVDAAHLSAIARAIAGAATVNGYLATIQSWQPPNSITEIFRYGPGRLAEPGVRNQDHEVDYLQSTVLPVLHLNPRLGRSSSEVGAFDSDPHRPPADLRPGRR